MQPAMNKSDLDELYHGAESILLNSLVDLINEGNLKGRWSSVRDTGDSILALNKCLEKDAFPILRKQAIDWLIQQAELEKSKNEIRYCWANEVWDTSLAVLALSTVEDKNNPTMNGGFNWLKGHFSEKQGNWNDEPWETCWALLAIYECAHIRDDKDYDEELLKEIKNAFDWLFPLFGKPEKGMLVTWHYTGLFILVARRYKELTYFRNNQPELINELDKYYNGSINCILRHLSKTPFTLWTDELWSNSLVLWALAESKKVDFLLPNLKTMLGELEGLTVNAKTNGKNQKDRKNNSHENKDHKSTNNNNFNEVLDEDRAFACIALLNFMFSIDSYRFSCVTKCIEDKRKAQIDDNIRPEFENYWKIGKDDRKENLKSKLIAYISNSPNLNKCHDYHKYPVWAKRENQRDYKILILGTRKKWLQGVFIFVWTISMASITWLAALKLSPPWSWIIGGIAIIIGSFLNVLTFMGKSISDIWPKKKENDNAD